MHEKVRESWRGKQCFRADKHDHGCRIGHVPHGRDCVPSARKAIRATPTAASLLSDVRTGTPSMVFRIQLQISFVAPPPTVVTQVGCGPPNSAMRW